MDVERALNPISSLQLHKLATVDVNLEASHLNGETQMNGHSKAARTKGQIAVTYARTDFRIKGIFPEPRQQEQQSIGVKRERERERESDNVRWRNEGD